MSSRTAKPNYSTASTASTAPHAAAQNGALPVRSMDEILAELDQRGQPQLLDVPCPELGATFRVRGLTRAETLRIMDRCGDQRRQHVDVALSEEMQLTTAVVEPKITVEHYRRLKHRSDMNPVINRLLEAIGTLTNGPTVHAPDGRELDPGDGAYFPVNGRVPASADG